MEKTKKNKIIFIVITILAFLLVLAGGILTIISVLLKETNLLYVGIPMMIGAFIIYIVLFIVLVVFFKKKE